MNFKSKIALATLFLIVTSGLSCKTNQYFVFTCNGEKVLIPKHPDKYYKDELSSWEISLKGSVEELKTVEKIELTPSIRKTVVSKREKLDQLSGRLRDIIYASSRSVERHPCDKAAAIRHQDLLTSIAKEVTTAEALKTSVHEARTASNFQGMNESKLRQAINEYETNSEMLNIPGI